MPLESFTSVDGSGRPQLDADEQVSFTADNTSLFLRGDKSEGAGTLFVTTKHLIWMALDRSAGYRMDYPYVLLHAVSRDTSSFPHPCLYAQLDDEVAEEAFATASMRQQAPAQDGEEDEDEDDEEEEPQPISELRFVPENAGIRQSTEQPPPHIDNASAAAAGAWRHESLRCSLPSLCTRLCLSLCVCVCLLFQWTLCTRP